ncbi:MAG: dolichyl-phosphate beta-D-mannosyltransferase [Verrucomicrobia bacterium]|nr:MAG: dolichyl-phosphate beta-D-mannosyltransferase [Verrucomicrobiota bacterium]
METDRTLIVVPTYNERENVGALVPQLLQVAADADVMLVDDNSPDGTAMFAEQLFRTEPRFSILRRTGSRSFGRSLLDGYRLALERGYARLVQMDADFSHEPKMVPALIDACRDADVVIGSRYCPGGRVVNWPWRRQLVSRFANEYVSVITGLTVRDSTSGFKCYARRALQCLLQVGITSEGYAFQVETVFRAQREGLRIVEIPITFTDRCAGQSKMSGKVIFESVLKPWRLRFGR